MAEKSGARRRSRRDSSEAGTSRNITPTSRTEKRSTKRSTKPTKERWLLTRKTWRYMADAGRKLIPDGASNRQEDVPKIEEYFQEICQKEPKFLLLRKASYPSTLGFRTHRRRRTGKGGSCRVKASSADEADIEHRGPSPGFLLQATSGGRFDITKMKRDFLQGTGSSPASPIFQRKLNTSPQDDAEGKALADMLQRYLNMQGDSSSAVEGGGAGSTAAREISAAGRQDPSQHNEPLNYQNLIDKLQQHLDLIMAQGRRKETELYSPGISGVPKVMLPYQGDYVHKSLLDTLSRYYSKSPNREHVISDILTDRKLLEKLYFDLRCTRGFRGPRSTGAYTSPSSQWLFNSSSTRPQKDNADNPDWPRERRRDLTSPPPLIAVQGPSTDRGPVDDFVQTDPVPREVLDSCVRELREEQFNRENNQKAAGGGAGAGAGAGAGGGGGRSSSSRRRSSVDNDDVSPSVSDTIKRYLRMARKKSMDADKVDRFKRVNYDRNLRNVKGKCEAGFRPSDDDGNTKGSQTDENWACNYRERFYIGEGFSDPETTSPGSRNASSRSSIDAGLGSEEPPSTPKQHQSFLSHLLHGSNTNREKPHSAPGSPAMTSSNSAGGAAMQKSKSSSSVVHHGSRLVAKKIWRSRSKSTSRASNQPSTWTPQGKCTWAGAGGRRVTLQDTSLRALSDVERRVLCQVAVAKLQALNLGVHIRPPTETLGNSVTTKPKRRAYLLKRKALTTGFFDNKGKEDKDKESAGGLVFGIPLSQCLENDRIARIAAASGEVSDVGGSLTRNSRHGSRASFTSLIEVPSAAAKTDEGGSCESLPSKGGALTCSSDSGLLELSDSGGGGGPHSEWDSVPAVVQQCIKHLETNGLHTLGVFRVSPSKKRVRQLREDFDCGRESKIGPDQCPHDVAALLKEYFRDLPDPLLCRDLYQAFVHTQKIRNRRLQQEALQHLIQLLPAPNRDTLWALLNFLGEVAGNSEDLKCENGEWIAGNKMDANNLATVFAPNILHCVKPGQTRPEVSAERAEERIDVINVVRALLEHSSVLFTVPAALLDELYLHMMDTHPADLDAALTRRADEQCGEDLDPCSEAETFSEEVNVVAAAPRKVWTREQCLHQTAGVGGDIGPRPRRPKRPGSRRKDGTARSNSVDSGSSEDPCDPRRKSSPMVITASLTIPMTGAFTLNLDDPDIPFIEDGPRQPCPPPRRQRQRSISGCSEGGGRHGSDSAVGSSATLSGDQPPSSPPSWASSPPASPDSAVTAVSYIPDQQAAVLQRVSFTTSSEVRQISRSTSQNNQQNNHHHHHPPPPPPPPPPPSSSSSSPLPSQIPQPSANPNAITPFQETSKSSSGSSSYTPSITSIGGAVLRSKTADIERMLHISRPEVGDSGNFGSSNTACFQSPQINDNAKYQRQLNPNNSAGSAVVATSSENKKYTKRRYTDSRHQTRHIPDAETLAGKSSPASNASTVAIIHSVGAGEQTIKTTTAGQREQQPLQTGQSSTRGSISAPVWKRRELISSAPKERETYF